MTRRAPHLPFVPPTPYPPTERAMLNVDLRVLVLQAPEGGEIKVYFHDRLGDVWRVYDCTPNPGEEAGRRLVTHVPPHPEAASRHFVARDGRQLSYVFGAEERGHEARALQPVMLADQLKSAHELHKASQPRFEPERRRVKSSHRD